jgi:hypothetical protein
MMKKLLLNVLLLLTMAIGAVAQSELTVNDGTATSGYVPVYGYYADAYLKCEYVIPASALAEMNGGTITAMKYYLSSPASDSWGTANFQIFMKEVDQTTISAYAGPDGATIVYEGSLDGTQSEMAIDFDEAYAYNGGNLLVGVYNTVPGSYKSVTFSGIEATSAAYNGYSYSDLSGVTTGTSRNFLPKTTFTYTTGSGPVCTKPSNLVISGVVTNAASFAWTAGDSETAWNLQYKKASDENWTEVNGLTSPSYNLSGIMPGTAYNVRVQAVCSEESASGW